jgi:hypothetical protein
MRGSRQLDLIMKKKENKIIVEAIDTCSWATSEENHEFVFAFDCFVSGHDDVGTQFLSIPYHQDFYVVMKDYCRYYEQYMMKQFAER